MNFASLSAALEETCLTVREHAAGRRISIARSNRSLVDILRVTLYAASTKSRKFDSNAGGNRDEGSAIKP
jgi:hypothetical protein